MIEAQLFRAPPDVTRNRPRILGQDHDSDAHGPTLPAGVLLLRCAAVAVVIAAKRARNGVTYATDEFSSTCRPPYRRATEAGRA